jgi:tRNA (cmo5U34)-methyltransferase
MEEKYTENFDDKAAQWDNNPMHWARSEAIAKELIRRIPLKKDMIALEFGAGTGILSFLLKDQIKEITLLDNSLEMIKIIVGKIDSTNSKNLKALNFDLVNADLNPGRFDIIFSQMALHHVEDVDNIIKKFSKLLNPGGFLAIADLYSEDGSFHGEGFAGHKGFNIEVLSNQFRNNGFVGINENQCFVIERKISENETKKFGVFLIIAKKT